MTRPAGCPDLSGVRGEIIPDEPLARHTSLKVGGPADLFVTPADTADLKTLLTTLRAAGMPWLIVGGGYNLLVRDGGFRGAAISLQRMGRVELVVEGLVEAEAGATNRQLVNFCRDNALTGLEFLCGIPGTVGGALRMNAGAHGGEILDHLETLVTLQGGRVTETAGKSLSRGYRFLELEEDEIILAGRFRLAQGDRAGIAQAIDTYLAHRVGSQKVGLPNAGSFFKNPPGGQAWRLIDEAGFRGYRVGGAQVSTVHTNFLVNAGGATATDFLLLADAIKTRVQGMAGVVLEEEVRIVGND